MRTLILALAVLPAPAFAACPPDAETVLSCTTRDAARALDICLVGDAITYAYGAPGQPPELALTSPVANIESHPWPGIGRAIWESVTFTNGEHRYEVAFGVDRIEQGDEILPDPHGSIIVWRGDTELATISCDAGSADVSLWAVTDAKQARGLCWTPEAQQWGSCPTD